MRETSWQAEIRILKAKNAILERALEWYADPHHIICYPDYGEPGSKARRALDRARKVK